MHARLCTRHRGDSRERPHPSLGPAGGGRTWILSKEDVEHKPRRQEMAPLPRKACRARCPPAHPLGRRSASTNPETQQSPGNLSSTDCWAPPRDPGSEGPEHPRICPSAQLQADPEAAGLGTHSGELPGRARSGPSSRRNPVEFATRLFSLQTAVGTHVGTHTGTHATHQKYVLVHGASLEGSAQPDAQTSVGTRSCHQTLRETRTPRQAVPSHQAGAGLGSLAWKGDLEGEGAAGRRRPETGSRQRGPERGGSSA